MNINEKELSKTDQYRFRMLKAKAEYLSMRPGINKNKASYARTICALFPDVDMERARRAVSFAIVDYDILDKLEKCNEICKNA